MKIIFGDIKIEIPYENYLKKFCCEKNPFEAKFPKYDQEFFSDLYKRTPSIMADYFAEMTKLMEKYTKMSKPDRSNG